MTCFFPQTVWYSKSLNPSGLRSVVFSASLALWADRPFQIPCGKCRGCRVSRSQQWAIRMMHESAMHSSSSFITLTFRDECLPPLNSICRSDMQNFFKRLRRSLSHPIRMFYCGEYGDKTLRPHYHACVFGEDFSADRTKYKLTSLKHMLYNSPTLSAAWPYGHAVIGGLSFTSAAYVARYVMKKHYGENANQHYAALCPDTGHPLFSPPDADGVLAPVTREPEFAQPSLKPGIGFEWFQKYHADVYPADRCVVKGKQMRPPRYYDTLLERMNPDLFSEIKLRRKKEMNSNENFAYDNTIERLSVRLKVFDAKINTLVRSLD